MIENGRNSERFDEFAETYRDRLADAVVLSGADSHYFSEYKVAELLKYEDAGAPMRILDFGCGDGNSSLYLRKHFPNATLFGVDVSEKSIEQAAGKKIPNADFVQFDGANLPYEDGSFDMVFASMVFHHIERQLHQDVLREIRRVLTEGGHFYNFEHNPYNPLTRRVVRECEFDEEAELLAPSYNRMITKAGGLTVEQMNFTLFFPRHRLFKPFLKLESLLRWCPVGAQYYIRAVRYRRLKA